MSNKKEKNPQTTVGMVAEMIHSCMPLWEKLQAVAIGNASARDVYTASLIMVLSAAHDMSNDPKIVKEVIDGTPKMMRLIGNILDYIVKTEGGKETGNCEK